MVRIRQGVFRRSCRAAASRSSSLVDFECRLNKIRVPVAYLKVSRHLFKNRFCECNSAVESRFSKPMVVGSNPIVRFPA